MNYKDYATYHEITTQTKAWSQAIDVMKRIPLSIANDYRNIIITGCGSTYYLSIAVAALMQALTGINSKAIPGSELFFNDQIIFSRDRKNQIERTLLIAISRSGTTTETIKAVEKFKSLNVGEVIVISNYDQDLSHLADVNIVISEGQERSVAQTRSFSSMYVAGITLCARMAGRADLVEQISGLPEIGIRLLKDFSKLARNLGEDLNSESFFFLGSGLRYGLACELSLKQKEMTLTHSEPFHFMEFRHGPMSMVDEKVRIIGLVSEENYAYEMGVVSDMKLLGARLLTLGETGTDIEFSSHLSEEIRGVLYLPIIQLMAFHRSMKKGLNPDSPKNLSAVVNLQL